MNTLFKIVIESIALALQELLGNKLRSFLSLLGITIGIWCMISVFSAVDSMETNVRQSFQKLGDDVIYVSPFSWMEDPSANYWKWMRNPDPNFADLKSLQKNLYTAKYVGMSYFIGSRTIQYRNYNVGGAFTIAISDQYDDIFNLGFDKGRFFSELEYQTGGNQVILGYQVAEELFGKNIEPIGKKVKLMGRQFLVIGVLEKSGQDLVNPLDYDKVAFINLNAARQFVTINNSRRKGASSIYVKAKDDISLSELKDDITVTLRSSRRIKPKSESNFALNSLSIISQGLDIFFGVFRLVGVAIGGFAILVSIFSVANIMFVSVKERTNLIGVKKALGAKRYVIMLEFLIESIVLCLLGGAMGLVLVYLTAYLATNFFGFEVTLSPLNVIIGLIISTVTGVIAGIIPAIIAAMMSPVKAIRSK